MILPCFMEGHKGCISSIKPTHTWSYGQIYGSKENVNVFKRERERECVSVICVCLRERGRESSERERDIDI